MSSDLSLPTDGTLFAGRYRPVRLLGRGGMGEVYLVEDSMLDGEQVALKLLKKDYLEDKKYISRFLREVKLARQITHPCVVRTYDVGEADGNFYLTMEYVDGESVKDILQRDGAFHYRDVCKMLTPLCEGLHEIHRNQIVHRDLKPGNIMLSSKFEVKITDFGIARPGTSELTHHDEIVGSTHYLAPEIWLGKELSSATDIYALGVVLYEMLTGCTPFEADNPAELMWKHLEVTPPPPSSLMETVPPWMDELVLALMSKDHDSRPCNALEVSDYVLRVTAEEEIRMTGDFLAPVVDEELPLEGVEAPVPGGTQELLGGHSAITQPAADLMRGTLDTIVVPELAPEDVSIQDAAPVQEAPRGVASLYFQAVLSRAGKLFLGTVICFAVLGIITAISPLIVRFCFSTLLRLTESRLYADGVRGLLVLSVLLLYCAVPFFLIRVQSTSISSAFYDSLRSYAVLVGGSFLLMAGTIFSVPVFSMSLFLKRGVESLIVLATLSPETFMYETFDLHTLETVSVLIAVFFYGCGIASCLDGTFTFTPQVITRRTALRSLLITGFLSLVSFAVHMLGLEALLFPLDVMFVSILGVTFELSRAILVSGMVSIIFLVLFALFAPLPKERATTRRPEARLSSVGERPLRYSP